MQLTEEWTNELTRRYSESHRRYHTLAHVNELLTLLRDFELADRDSVEAAVWFHDAIYDTHANDNEARSAELAGTALREMNFGNIDVVQAMINATATHDSRGLTRDGLLFLDADLSILGAPPERYRAYAGAIRAEYSWVPDAMFALERPSIYQTGEMRARFEVQARENVARELAELQAARGNQSA